MHERWDAFLGADRGSRRAAFAAYLAALDAETAAADALAQTHLDMAAAAGELAHAHSDLAEAA